VPQGAFVPGLRRRKPRRQRHSRPGAAPARRTPASPLRLLGSIVYDLAAIAAEMLAIPARLWMRAAEAAGAVVLRVALALWPILVGAWKLAGRILERAARVVTPLRATTVVAVAAALALGASQFSDYRTVDIGAAQYQSVQSVAPAPEVASHDPRSAHGAWLIVIAGLSLVVIAVSVTRRPRLARALVPLGLAAVAIAVLHDHDTGLKAGRAGITYEGAQPVLLEGYWAELAAGAVLAACGPLLALHARRREPRTASSGAPRLRRAQRPRSRPAGAAG